MKIQTKSITLPTFAKAYRNGFKSGHGGDNGALKQFASRCLFYFFESTGCCSKGRLEILMDVRGKEVCLRLDPTNRQFNSLYFDIFKGGYENLVARSIKHFLPNDGVFADVGSNWGYFTLLFGANEDFTGKIHAFEPIPGTFKDLREVVEQSGLEQWVTPHHMALGNESGSVKMSKPRHSGLAHISKTGVGIDVKLATIDSFKWDQLDVVKIDVEGHELAVFQGAETTLNRCLPVLIFENGVDEEKALEPIQFLEEKNYHFFRPEVTEGKLVFYPFTAKNRDQQPGYLNIVAVPETRLSEVEASIVN